MASDYLAFLDRMADEYGIPRAEARAIYQLESSSGQNARRSPAGAIGHMQLMPGTARDLGVDPNDPYQNIRGGVRYYAQQRKKFGDPVLAAAAYNAGPGNVQKAGGVPRFAETRKYVTGFRNLIGARGQMTPAPQSATPASVAPQEPPMDETEEATGALSGLGGGLGGAPTSEEWTDLQRRSGEQATRTAANRKQQFEEDRQLIQQMYGGPSSSERLWALSQALLSPKPYKGFGGTLYNVTRSLGEMRGEQETADRRRSEALLRLRQSYTGAEDEAATGALDRELEFLKARYAANKPGKQRTGFNPITGDLTDLDTGLPITPPAPKVGEVRRGYRYLGGDPATPSSWKKV